MGKIQTYSGRIVDPLNVSPHDVDIIDIAHSLSHLCRFNGHVSRFYSVAQHSVVVCNKCEGDIVSQKWALLHDAAEAYLSDVPAPIKPMLVGFDDWESKILESVAEVFGLPKTVPDLVWEMDKAVLEVEMAVLMNRQRLSTADSRMVSMVLNPQTAKFLFESWFDYLF